jgi:hypothetical protein
VCHAWFLVERTLAHIFEAADVGLRLLDEDSILVAVVITSEVKLEWSSFSQTERMLGLQFLDELGWVLGGMNEVVNPCT